CGRQGCQRMVNGQLTDSTWGRRPVIWFSTCCCPPAKYLPASSNPAFPPPPSIRRAVLAGFTRSARRLSFDGAPLIWDRDRGRYESHIAVERDDPRCWRMGSPALVVVGGSFKIRKKSCAPV